MKRLGALIACSSLALMAGLSVARADIVWWSWNWDSAWQEQTWTEKAAEFTKQTGIKVDIRIMPWNELAPAVQTGSSADRVGDVVMVPHTDYVWLSRSNLLSDLSAMLPNMNPDDFIPSVLAGMKEDGKVYGIPTRRAGYALVYNEEILKKAGIDAPPVTMDELVADARAVSEKVPGAYGWGMPLMPTGNAYNRWENVFYSYGGRWLNEDKSDIAPTLQDAALKAFQLHVDLLPYTPPSRVEDTNDDMVRLASQGLVGLWQNTLSSVSTMKEMTPEALRPSIKYAPFPAGIEGNLGVTSVNGWDMVIPAASQNKDEAKKFLEYWTTGENMGNTVLTLPARLSSMSNPRVQNYPKAFLSGNGVDTLSEAWSGEIRTVVWDQLQGIALGEVDAQKATDALVAAVRAQLAK